MEGAEAAAAVVVVAAVHLSAQLRLMWVTRNLGVLVMRGVGTYGAETPQTTPRNGQTLDGRGYTVAVMDKGFHRAEHNNLQGNADDYAQRFIKVAPQDDPKDNHGLAVAGVIGAQGGNNFPKGVAPQASLLLIYPRQFLITSSNNLGRSQFRSRIPDLTNTQSVTPQAIKTTAEGLVQEWDITRDELKRFLDKQLGTTGAQDTQANLEKSVRGLFFKTERVSGSQFRFTGELRDELQSQPLVSINYSFIYFANQIARAFLMRRAAAKFCLDNYDDYFDNYISGVPKETICGSVDKTANDDGYRPMQFSVYDAAMKENAGGFTLYINALTDALDKALETSTANNPATYNALRDLTYDLGKKGAVSVVASWQRWAVGKIYGERSQLASRYCRIFWQLSCRLCQQE